MLRSNFFVAAYKDASKDDSIIRFAYQNKHNEKMAT